ncbi:MAG: hypothetical protein ACHRXM_07955 [Isosphaerales bacterium]
MRRFRFLLAATFLVAPVIAGCDSGLKEEMATDTSNPTPPALKNEMQKNAKNMVMPKGKPKAAPAAPAEAPK